jgi:hypothetical protein
MKKIRTSFNQFVREKVIHGVSGTWPEAQDVPINVLMSDVVHESTGLVEYQDTDHTETGLSAGSFHNQGPMGYGPPPVGPGTEPFTCFLSNKVLNAQATDHNIMTGSPSITPSLKLKDLDYSGVGCTFSIGQALQYRYDTDPAAKVDMKMAVNESHALVILHGVNNTTDGLGVTGNSDDDIKFMYKQTSDLSFDLYILKGDNTAIGSPQSFNHYIDSYGRMLPVHFVLNADGTGEFRVDNAKITFDLTSGDFSSFNVPATGTIGMTISGLTPYSTGSVFGMTSCISRLTNVAVNDNSGSADIGLPSFIHGVSCTPIRKAAAPGDSAWEFPKLVNDAFDNWTPFSENSPTVTYGLSAVMDNQTFDTRGVATGTLSADLDIYMTKQSIVDRLLGSSVTDDIEAINIKAYNAATFNNNDLAIKIHDSTSSWDTPWTVFDGLYEDPEIDSHVTFFHKTGNTAFSITDFNNDLIFKIRAQEK